jgi:site-specific recombinase XerD
MVGLEYLTPPQETRMLQQQEVACDRHLPNLILQSVDFCNITARKLDHGRTSLIRVRGKGNKTRFLPLAPEANQLLDHYLRLERPQTSTNALFVSLKGPARGTRMTPAGLRSLFRYHRRTTGVKISTFHISRGSGRFAP